MQRKVHCDSIKSRPTSKRHWRSICCYLRITSCYDHLSNHQTYLKGNKSQQTDYRIWRLTLTTRGIGFTEQNYVCFLKILTFHRLFQELLNQYQTCWYLFQCIYHGGSKYGHKIPQFGHFLQMLLNVWPVVCTRLPRGKHLTWVVLLPRLWLISAVSTHNNSYESLILKEFSFHKRAKAYHAKRGDI